MSQLYVQRGNFDTALFDDEWVVLDAEHYTITKLNEVGGFCWSMLEDHQSSESIMKALVREYGHVAESSKHDIEEFLTELVKCGLVEHVR